MDGLQLKPLQREVANKVFMSEKYRHHVYIAGRQSGKTHFAGWACMYMMMQLLGAAKPPSRRMRELVEKSYQLSSVPAISIVMPQQTQAYSFGKETLSQLVQTFRENYPNVHLSQSRQSWKVDCAHRERRGVITLHGLKEPQTLRGKTRVMIVTDEVADMDFGEVSEVLEPMIDKTGGIMLHTGTAKSNLSLKNLVETHRARDNATVTTHTIYDELRKGQITQAQLDDKIASFPNGEEDYLFRQEYCADWTQAPQGAVLKDWAMEPAPPNYTDRVLDWVVSMDIGFATECVVMVWAVIGGGKVVLHDARSWHETKTRDIIDKVAKNNLGRSMHVYVPHDARRRSAITGSTEESLWRDAPFAQTVRMTPQRRGKLNITPAESIRITRVRLGDILVCEAMRNNRVVEHARNCKYRDGTEEHLKDNVHDHAFDAFRYGVVAMDVHRHFEARAANEEEGWVSYTRELEQRANPTRAGQREFAPGTITRL